MVALPAAEEWRTVPEGIELDGREAWAKFSNWFIPAYGRLIFPPVTEQTSSLHRKCIILDVGANDGGWSQAVMKLARRVEGEKARRTIEFHLFEPQPKFHGQGGSLDMATKGWDAFIHEAAAWNDDTKNLTFFLARTSVSASLNAVNSWHSGIPRRGPSNISVRTVNLASYMKRVLPPIPMANETLVVLKLDVESAEYELLPYLIATGSLCRVHALLIEWHLNSRPAADRLSALGLRLSLSAQVRHACKRLYPSKPRFPTRIQAPYVIHEGAPINNWEQQVPGLWDVALHHNGTPVPGERPSRLVALWAKTRHAYESGDIWRDHKDRGLPHGVRPG